MALCPWLSVLEYPFGYVSVPVCCLCDLGSHGAGLNRTPPSSLEVRSLLSAFTPLAHSGLTSLIWTFPWKQSLPSAASVPRSLAPSQDSILQSGRKSFVLRNHSPCWGNHSPFLSFCLMGQEEEMGWPYGSRSCRDREPSKGLTEWR